MVQFSCTLQPSSITMPPQSPRIAAPGPTYTSRPMTTLPVTVAFGMDERALVERRGRIPSNGRRRSPSRRAHDRRHSLSHADAHRAERVAAAGALELVRRREQQARARTCRADGRARSRRRCGFTRGSSSAMPSSRRHASDCAANASFSSITSDLVEREPAPARARLRDAGTGPIPICAARRRRRPSRRCARAASTPSSRAPASDAIEQCRRAVVQPRRVARRHRPLAVGAERRLAAWPGSRASCRGE